MSTFLVNEIYPCLQGEGTNIGVPSVLVRLHLCNLRCTFCDTPYTHTLKSDLTEDGRPKQRRLSSEEIAAEIMRHKGISHVILSGGEPTLQNLALLRRMLPYSYSVEVESNGTQIPHKKFISFSFQDYFSFQWNISPKMSNAGEEIIEESLSHWSKLSTYHNRVFFKFVIRKDYQEEDLEEVDDVIEKFLIPHQKVILMAEGTAIDQQKDASWLAEYCQKKGYRYSPRLHVILYGHKRLV